MTAKSMDHRRDQILKAALPLVPAEGWSDHTLRTAAKAAGFLDGNPDFLELAFPDGALGLLDRFLADGDRRMRRGLAAQGLADMRIRDRIATAVRLRIEADTDHREAVRRGVALMSLPGSAPMASRALARTVDAIWVAAGDTATDINFYTKRALLAGVYGATLLFWLGDTSPDCRDSWQFLDRRIANVMQIEKLKAGLRKTADAMPSPWEALARMRYPESAPSPGASDASG